MRYQFEYDVSGVMENGEVRELNGGKAVDGFSVKEDDYIDDGILFARACDMVASHFYTFEVEKKGGSNLVEITVKIKNMQVDWTESTD